jgi:uncharacterized integral membrane protein (TIGR00697 family)
VAIAESPLRIRRYRYYDLVLAGFVAVLLCSNLIGTAKVAEVALPILGVSLVFGVGNIFFPISYIFGDVLTEVYGYRRSRRVIWAGFGANVLLGLFVWLAGVLPGETEWQGYAGQEAYDAILGGVSGLIVASLAAYFLGEFSNSYVLAKMKVWTEGRWLWARTIGSTLVGQLIDTTVFMLIATALGVFPPELMLTLIATNYILKVGLEVLLTPMTYRIVTLLKAAEREDYFDRQTDFNPFKLSA